MSKELETSIYEDDGYNNKQFKSRRFPDQHGGLPNASATPDQRLIMQGVEEPKSELILDKVSQQKYDFIHGRHGPSASLPVLVNLLNNSIEQLKTLKEIQQLIEYKIPIGQVRAFKLSYGTGGGFTHIEFTDSQFTFGVPSGQVINEPQRKLYRVRVINDGPGSIKFSTNVPRGDMSAELTLVKGDYDEIVFDYPIIWSLNISTVAGTGTTGGADAAVRVFYGF